MSVSFPLCRLLGVIVVSVGTFFFTSYLLGYGPVCVMSLYYKLSWMIKQRKSAKQSSLSKHSYRNENQPILVENSFEITNGCLGVGKNIFLRLSELLWYEEKKIIAIVGMCQEHVTWSSHPYFVKWRPKKVPYSFFDDPSGRSLVCHTAAGLQCKFNPNQPTFPFPFGCFCLYKGDDEDYIDRMIFLNSAINEGIYRWTVRIKYALFKPTTFNLGASPPDLLSAKQDRVLDLFSNNSARTAYLSLWRDGPGLLRSYIYGVGGEVPPDETQVPQGACVAIEVDANAHTLAFFVNGTKIPHIITHMRFPVHLGVTGSCGSFFSLSYLRLRFPTQSETKCKLHEKYYLEDN